MNYEATKIVYESFSTKDKRSLLANRIMTYVVEQIVYYPNESPNIEKIVMEIKILAEMLREKEGNSFMRKIIT